MPMKRILNSFLLSWGTLLGTVVAEPGDIDTSFGVSVGASFSINAAVFDEQERILVAGEFSSFDEAPASGFVRLTPNGAIDPTFDPGSGANRPIKAIAVLPDQRILIGGGFTEFNGTPSRGIALLNSDGSIDPTFESQFESAGFSVGVACVKILSNGNFAVGGYFTEYANQTAGRYVIISPSGVRLDAIASGSGADSHVFEIDELADGKLLICGFFDEVNGFASPSVARLHSNGAVDTSFSAQLTVSAVTNSVEGQSDGKVIIGGSSRTVSGSNVKYLRRLLPNGFIDHSYLGADSPDLSVYGLQLDSQERLIVSGQFATLDGRPAEGIGRLLQNGAIDESFQFTESVRPSFFQEYPIDGLGRILAYGWANSPFNSPSSNLLRLEGDKHAPRERWLYQHFGTLAAEGESAWSATPANDGVTNLLKYALGYQGSPKDPVAFFGDDGLLYDFWKNAETSGFHFQTDAERTDVRADPQWSLDLSSWFDTNLVIEQTASDDSLTTWRVTLPMASPAAFFQMRISDVE